MRRSGARRICCCTFRRSRRQAGLPRPTVEDWIAVNRRVPRLVSVLPNGPVHHPTVRVFLAGGVPEVLLHLRRLGLIEAGVLTVEGVTLGEVLEASGGERTAATVPGVAPGVGRRGSGRRDPAAGPGAGGGVDEHGPVPAGQPGAGGGGGEGDVDRSVGGGPGRGLSEGGPVRVFASERAAIGAIKAGAIRAGDVLVLAGCGPLGTGMEEAH